MNFKKFVSITLAVLTVLSLCVPAFGDAAPPSDIISETWCVMDAKTGQMLIGGDPDKRMEPASLTKVLTCALALEVLEPRNSYTFSAEAASYDRAGTHLAFSEGETCKIEDLLYGAMVESANDCAMALADAVSGSQLEFVRLMNRKLEELGCTGSHFANATGMPDANHYTTARDMAIITKYALSVPGFETYFNAWEWTIPATNKNTERKFGTHHSMIVGSENNGTYGYDPATGGKLGWTEEALHTAVTVAEKNDLRLICVVLKSRNKSAKYKDTKALFEYCFNNFYKIEVPVSVPKKEIVVYDGEELYGKMVVHPMASLEVAVTNGFTKDDIACKANIPDSCLLSEMSGVAVEVSFKKTSTAMSTEPFTVSPDYHVIKESSVVSADAEVEEKTGSIFKGWYFIAIPLGILLFLVVAVLIIRAYNIQKYKKLRRHRHYNRLKRG